jgi:fructose-1,6-bisphosphatase/inositol monophosphatase family enzyme
VAAGIVIAREAGREVRTWDNGPLIDLVVGDAEDLSELAPLVELFSSRRVAPAV